MSKIIELTKECNQMRNEDTAHMTQSWWKQISQMNACQWYSPSSWPDTSQFCSIWQYFSVSLNVIPQKCPAGSWTWTTLSVQPPSCMRSVQHVMNTAGAHFLLPRWCTFCPSSAILTNHIKLLGHPHGQWGIDWPLPSYKRRNQRKPSCFL